MKQRVTNLVLTVLVFVVISSLIVYKTRQSLHRDGPYRVKRVIDGDTIILTSGEKVRYAGIDAPEMDEPFYKEARERNKTLVEGREVSLRICTEQPRDRHGRVLAWVYVDGVSVNEVLLREGLARVFTLPPCGLKNIKEYRRLEGLAREKSLGIWSEVETIHPHEARQYRDRIVSVRGRVVDVYDSGRAIFLNFGEDHRRDFTGVILAKGRKRFRESGIDPMDYKGRIVTVTGRINIYRGRPEIVIDDPSQISISEQEGG